MGFPHKPTVDEVKKWSGARGSRLFLKYPKNSGGAGTILKRAQGQLVRGGANHVAAFKRL